jgi:rSAM/selenodomain-associated transferase 2
MISIIIPTLNEADQLPSLLRYLNEIEGKNYISEIIVSDACSSDGTAEIARKNNAAVIHVSQRGRAQQMNAAAKVAQGQILYFLHADSYPPKDFPVQIHQYVSKGSAAGCFRLRFDHDHWFLKLNAWFTRFSFNSFRFGDQSLFIKKDLFLSIGGFNENLILLEDQEIVNRISSHHRFKVIPAYIITSARKYVQNGVVRLQLIYFYIYFLYRVGFSQQFLLQQYKRLVKS